MARPMFAASPRTAAHRTPCTPTPPTSARPTPSGCAGSRPPASAGPGASRPRRPSRRKCRRESECLQSPPGSPGALSVGAVARPAAVRKSSSRPTNAAAPSTSTPCGTPSARTSQRRAPRRGRPRPPCGTATRASRPTFTPTRNSSTWPERSRARRTCRTCLSRRLVSPRWRGLPRGSASSAPSHLAQPLAHALAQASVHPGHSLASSGRRPRSGRPRPLRRNSRNLRGPLEGGSTKSRRCHRS